MATIEEGLVSKLTTEATIAAIVGTRVRPEQLAAGDIHESIVYRRVDGAHEKAFNGPVGLAQAEFELELWAPSYARSKALREAVRKKLDGKTWSAGGVNIDGSFLEDAPDLIERGVGSQHRLTFGVGYRLRCWYQESTS